MEEEEEGEVEGVKVWRFKRIINQYSIYLLAGLVVAGKVGTGSPRKKFTMTPGSILSQSQAFSTESNQSQSSIYVNTYFCVRSLGVTGYFLLENP